MQAAHARAENRWCFGACRTACELARFGYQQECDHADLVPGMIFISPA